MPVDLNLSFDVENGLTFGETGVAIFSGTEDPSTGAGISAPVGSLFLRSNGTLYIKFGALDTEWAFALRNGDVVLNIQDPPAGPTISGDPITNSGTLTFALANDLAAIEGLTGTGLATRISADIWANRSIDGTTNEIVVDNGSGDTGNPTVRIADNPIIPGTASLTVPAGPTAERPATPVNGMLRYNTEFATLEAYLNGVWTLFARINSNTDWIDFNPQVTPPDYLAGRVYYDESEHALTVYDNVAGSSVQLGFETLVRVKNITGVTIPNGTVVYINGASGDYPTVDLATTQGPTNSVLGIATSDILNGTESKVTVRGLLNDLDTSLWAPGTQLYLDENVPGGMSAARPLGPDNAIVSLGIVVIQSATNGRLYVNIHRVYSEELYDAFGGQFPVDQLDGGTNASNTTFWRGDGTWSSAVTSVGISPPTQGGISVSNSPITTSGNIQLNLVDDLLGLEGLTGAGLATRTSANTWTNRSIVGTTNQVVVTNGNGVDGNISLSLPTALIAPGSLQYTTNFGWPVESITATGTDQATATPVNITTTLITGGDVGTGVILPASPFSGEIHAVTNNTETIKYVYPAVGIAIDDGVVNSPAFITPGLVITFVWDGTKWVTLQSSLSAGNSGISITRDDGNVLIFNEGVLTFSGGTTGLSPVSPSKGNIVLSGTLGIANGGTGATSASTAFTNLSPTTTAGDLIYRNGASDVRLPIGSNTQVLSVVSGLPSWISQNTINAGTSVTSTTASNLAGGSTGSVPYQTGSGTTTFLSAGTSSQVLVSGTSPSWVSVATALGYTPVNIAGDTMTGFLTLNADPTSPLHAATKQYVDATATGLTFHDPARVATTGNLTASYVDGTTDTNGGLGIGATLTNSGTQAALVIDGVTFSVGDAVLVKHQTDPIENGVYTVSDVGSSSTNWVLTRSTDFDDSTDGNVTGGDYVFIQAGTLYQNTSWVQVTQDPILGTDPIVFQQFSAANTYTAGTGLQLTGNQFSNTGVLSNIAGTGISVSSATGNVTIANTGVTSIIAGTGVSVSASTGAVTISSSSAAPTTAVKTSNYTMVSGDYTIFADAGAGGFTVTLPASPVAGEIHNIKKIDETRSSVIISGNGVNIDKYPTVTMNVPYTSIAVQWNSTSSRWHII